MVKGERLKNLRKAKGLTQSELGQLIGVKKSVICLYERELRNPTLESIIKLCEIFNVDADYLIGSDTLVSVSDADKKDEVVAMTKDEVYFMVELRKNQSAYSTLISDPKRGIDLIKSKICQNTRILEKFMVQLVRNDGVGYEKNS